MFDFEDLWGPNPDDHGGELSEDDDEFGGRPQHVELREYRRTGGLQEDADANVPLSPRKAPQTLGEHEQEEEQDAIRWTSVCEQNRGPEVGHELVSVPTGDGGWGRREVTARDANLGSEVKASSSHRRRALRHVREDADFLAMAKSVTDLNGAQNLPECSVAVGGDDAK